MIFTQLQVIDGLIQCDLTIRKGAAYLHGAVSSLTAQIQSYSVIFQIGGRSPVISSRGHIMLPVWVEYQDHGLHFLSECTFRKPFELSMGLYYL